MIILSPVSSKFFLSNCLISFSFFLTILINNFSLVGLLLIISMEWYASGLNGLPPINFRLFLNFEGVHLLKLLLKNLLTFAVFIYLWENASLSSLLISFKIFFDIFLLFFLFGLYLKFWYSSCLSIVFEFKSMLLSVYFLFFSIWKILGNFFVSKSFFCKELYLLGESNINFIGFVSFGLLSIPKIFLYFLFLKSKRREDILLVNYSFKIYQF